MQLSVVFTCGETHVNMDVSVNVVALLKSPVLHPEQRSSASDFC